MTILNDIAMMDNRRALFEEWERRTPKAILASLRSAWDVWERSDCVDDFGMARSPHLAILEDIDITTKGLRPVLSFEMSLAELEAGVFRQIGILPDNPTTTSQRASDAEAENGGKRPSVQVKPHDRFAPSRFHSPEREWFLAAFTGHTPRDIADFIADLRAENEDLARIVLAKALKTIARDHPELLFRPWPEATRTRWKKTGAKDHLPGIAAATIYAEFSRLAQNVCNHIVQSFDDSGKEIFLRPFLDTAPCAGGPLPTPRGVARLVEMAPFTSIALTPPAELLTRLDSTECGRWSREAAGAMTIEIVRTGQDGLSILRNSDDARAGAFFRDGINANPRFWKTYHSRGWYLGKGHPITFRGYGWRLHAALGLLSLAIEARNWSAVLREGQNVLKSPKEDRPLEKAMMAIIYCWVEATIPIALPTALQPVIVAKQKQLGRQLTDEERSIDELSRGESFGSTLFAEARNEMPKLPLPGAEGYTAWYHAHLWFNDRGDDIHAYVAHQMSAVTENRRRYRKGNSFLEKHLQRAPMINNASQSLTALSTSTRAGRRALRRFMKMTKALRPARVAQDCAMALLPPSIDTMFAVNAAPHRWVEPPDTAIPPNAKPTRNGGSKAESFAANGTATPDASAQP